MEVIFDLENLWRGIRVSWEIILRLFYLWRKVIINFHRFCQFHEIRGIDTSDGHCSILHVPFHFVSFFPFENGMQYATKERQIYFWRTCESFEHLLFHQFPVFVISRKCDIRIEKWAYINLRKVRTCFCWTVEKSSQIIKLKISFHDDNFCVDVFKMQIL